MSGEAVLSIGPPSDPQIAGEPGDTFDAPPEVAEVVTVDETLVRGLLRAAGSGVSELFADEDVPDQWRFTEVELDELTPPLTRWINRRPKIVRAVAHGDEGIIVLVLAGYLGRNVAAGKAAQEARDHEDVDRQVDGAPGPAGAPAGPGFGVPGWGSAASAPGGGGVHPPAG